MSGRLQAVVAEEVRVELARKNRSASWLAREAGVTQTWMSGRLTGRTPMTIDDLELVANTLEIPLQRLLSVELVAKVDSDEGSSKRRYSALQHGVSQREQTALKRLVPAQAAA